MYDDNVEHQPPALPALSWPPCSQQEEHQDNGVGKECGGSQPSRMMPAHLDCEVKEERETMWTVCALQIK